MVQFVAQRTVVDGSSMETTLSDGDNLIVDKLSYRIGEPKRFDVVVFQYLHKSGTYYIKRIIGLPGETVQITDDGTILIDGKPLKSDTYGLAPIQDAGLAKEPVRLGDNEYFVLGDNRNASTDSRFSDVGNVRRSAIIGKAWMRIFPFNRIKIIR